MVPGLRILNGQGVQLELLLEHLKLRFGGFLQVDPEVALLIGDDIAYRLRVLNYQEAVVPFTEECAEHNDQG
jgi:hypothetical protein